MRMNILVLIGFIVITVFVNAGISAVIHVPADYPLIQQGIDAATDGDTVLVAPGTYFESIEFKGKDITVKSSGGAEATIIDGGNPTRNDIFSLVYFIAWEGPDSVLDGFTLTNGSGTPGYHGWFNGSAVFCQDSAPTLCNNIITKNSGLPNPCNSIVYCDHSSPIITNNKIIENLGFGAAGVYCTNASSPLVLGNDISKNSGLLGGRGVACYDSSPTIMNNRINENVGTAVGCWGYGCSPEITNNIIANNHYYGIRCSSGSSPVIQNNWIEGNKVDKGAGIRCEESSPLIMDNVIIGNTASDWGGGIGCWLNSSPVIVNNIIAGNSAKLGGGGISIGYCSAVIANNTITGNYCNSYGGGIDCDSYSTLTMVNTIVWNNQCSKSSEITLSGTCEFILSYSDVKGGKDKIYNPSGGEIVWGPGMIDADPLFVDAANEDFHITYNSPCRDTGDNSAVTELYDFEGDPRIAWNGTVDMGADEFYTHLYCVGDFTPGGSIEGKLLGLPGTPATGLFFGSGVLDPPLPTIWGNFHLQAPWRIYPLVPIPETGVLVIPETIPPRRPAPYDLPMQALIGLNPDSLTNLEVLEVR
jgi:parallel beta-helix repeat protein